MASSLRACQSTSSSMGSLHKVVVTVNAATGADPTTTNGEQPSPNRLASTAQHHLRNHSHTQNSNSNSNTVHPSVNTLHPPPVSTSGGLRSNRALSSPTSLIPALPREESGAQECPQCAVRTSLVNDLHTSTFTTLSARTGENPEQQKDDTSAGPVTISPSSACAVPQKTPPQRLSITTIIPPSFSAPAPASTSNRNNTLESHGAATAVSVGPKSPASSKPHPVPQASSPPSSPSACSIPQPPPPLYSQQRSTFSGAATMAEGSTSSSVGSGPRRGSPLSSSRCHCSAVMVSLEEVNPARRTRTVRTTIDSDEDGKESSTGRRRLSCMSEEIRHPLVGLHRRRICANVTPLLLRPPPPLLEPRSAETTSTLPIDNSSTAPLSNCASSRKRSSHRWGSMSSMNPHKNTNSNITPQQPQHNSNNIRSRTTNEKSGPEHISNPNRLFDTSETQPLPTVRSSSDGVYPFHAIGALGNASVLPPHVWNMSNKLQKSTDRDDSQNPSPATTSYKRQIVTPLLLVAQQTTTALQKPNQQEQMQHVQLKNSSMNRCNSADAGRAKVRRERLAMSRSSNELQNEPSLKVISVESSLGARPSANRSAAFAREDENVVIIPNNVVNCGSDRSHGTLQSRRPSPFIELGVATRAHLHLADGRQEDRTSGGDPGIARHNSDSSDGSSDSYYYAQLRSQLPPSSLSMQNHRYLPSRSSLLHYGQTGGGHTAGPTHQIEEEPQQYSNDTATWKNTKEITDGEGEIHNEGERDVVPSGSPECVLTSAEEGGSSYFWNNLMTPPALNSFASQLPHENGERDAGKNNGVAEDKQFPSSLSLQMASVSTTHLATSMWHCSLVNKTRRTLQIPIAIQHPCTTNGAMERTVASHILQSHGAGNPQTPPQTSSQSTATMSMARSSSNLTFIPQNGANHTIRLGQPMVSIPCGVIEEVDSIRHSSLSMGPSPSGFLCLQLKREKSSPSSQRFGVRSPCTPTIRHRSGSDFLSGEADIGLESYCTSMPLQPNMLSFRDYGAFSLALSGAVSTSTNMLMSGANNSKNFCNTSNNVGTPAGGAVPERVVSVLATPESPAFPPENVSSNMHKSCSGTTNTRPSRNLSSITPTHRHRHHKNRFSFCMGMHTRNSSSNIINHQRTSHHHQSRNRRHGTDSNSVAEHQQNIGSSARLSHHRRHGHHWHRHSHFRHAHHHSTAIAKNAAHSSQAASLVTSPTTGPDNGSSLDTKEQLSIAAPALTATKSVQPAPGIPQTGRVFPSTARVSSSLSLLLKESSASVLEHERKRGDGKGNVEPTELRRSGGKESPMQNSSTLHLVLPPNADTQVGGFETDRPVPPKWAPTHDICGDSVFLRSSGARSPLSFFSPVSSSTQSRHNRAAPQGLNFRSSFNSSMASNTLYTMRLGSRTQLPLCSAAGGSVYSPLGQRRRSSHMTPSVLCGPPSSEIALELVLGGGMGNALSRDGHPYTTRHGSNGATTSGTSGTSGTSDVLKMSLMASPRRPSDAGLQQHTTPSPSSVSDRSSLAKNPQASPVPLPPSQGDCMQVAAHHPRPCPLRLPVPSHEPLEALDACTTWERDEVFPSLLPPPGQEHHPPEASSTEVLPSSTMAFRLRSHTTPQDPLPVVCSTAHSPGLPLRPRPLNELLSVASSSTAAVLPPPSSSPSAQLNDSSLPTQKPSVHHPAPIFKRTSSEGCDAPVGSREKRVASDTTRTISMDHVEVGAAVGSLQTIASSAAVGTASPLLDVQNFLSHSERTERSANPASAEKIDLKRPGSRGKVARSHEGVQSPSTSSSSCSCSSCSPSSRTGGSSVSRCSCSGSYSDNGSQGSSYSCCSCNCSGSCCRVDWSTIRNRSYFFDVKEQLLILDGVGTVESVTNSQKTTALAHHPHPHSEVTSPSSHLLHHKGHHPHHSGKKSGCEGSQLCPGGTGRAMLHSLIGSPISVLKHSGEFAVQRRSFAWPDFGTGNDPNRSGSHHPYSMRFKASGQALTPKEVGCTTSMESPVSYTSQQHQHQGVPEEGCRNTLTSDVVVSFGTSHPTTSLDPISASPFESQQPQHQQRGPNGNSPVHEVGGANTVSDLHLHRVPPSRRVVGSATSVKAGTHTRVIPTSESSTSAPSRQKHHLSVSSLFLEHSTDEGIRLVPSEGKEEDKQSRGSNSGRTEDGGEPLHHNNCSLASHTLHRYLCNVAGPVRSTNRSYYVSSLSRNVSQLTSGHPSQSGEAKGAFQLPNYTLRTSTATKNASLTQYHYHHQKYGRQYNREEEEHSLKPASNKSSADSFSGGLCNQRFNSSEALTHHLESFFGSSGTSSWYKAVVLPQPGNFPASPTFLSPRGVGSFQGSLSSPQDSRACPNHLRPRQHQRSGNPISAGGSDSRNEFSSREMNIARMGYRARTPTPRSSGALHHRDLEGSQANTNGGISSVLQTYPIIHILRIHNAESDTFSLISDRSGIVHSHGNILPNSDERGSSVLQAALCTQRSTPPTSNSKEHHQKVVNLTSSVHVNLTPQLSQSSSQQHSPQPKDPRCPSLLGAQGSVFHCPMSRMPSVHPLYSEDRNESPKMSPISSVSPLVQDFSFLAGMLHNMSSTNLTNATQLAFKEVGPALSTSGVSIELS